MSNNIAADAVAAAPMAELVIRAGDTRPVVLTMASDFNKTGEVYFSPGPLEDLKLAAWVLEFMRNSVGDELLTREQRVIRDFFGVEEPEEVDSDDVPF